MKILKERYEDRHRTEKIDRHSTGKLSHTAAEVSSSTEPPIFRTLAKPISYPLHSSVLVHGIYRTSLVRPGIELGRTAEAFQAPH